MPDDVTPAAAGGETPAADPNEGVTPAAARPVVEPSSSAPKDQRPGIMDIWAAEKEAGTLDAPDDDEDKPAATGDEPAKPADEPKGDEPSPTADKDKPAAAAPADEDADKDKPADADADAAAADAEKAKADLDSLLETYDDPAVLNAALARAGVDKLQELPAVKDLIGRITQGVRDSTKAEIAKAQAQAAQLAEVTAEGKAAKGKLIESLNQLAADIEDGKEDGLAIPTEEAIAKAFEDYAGAAVGEYHTKAWNVLSDQLYSLPEMGGPIPEGLKTTPPDLTPEQAELLDAVKGASPDIWLAGHLAVERDRLWAWAQAEAAANGQGSFENDKVVLQAAHAKEIRDLTKAHDEAIKTAREEARAEALADASSGKLPPKTPKGAKPVTTASTEEENESVFKGKTPGEIRTIIKERQGAGVEV